MTRRNGAWWRRRVWASISLLLLIAYLIGTTHPARRTAVGTEHYLFGIGTSPPTLLESPGGGSWLLAPSTPESVVTGNPAVDAVLSQASRFQWPGAYGSPRHLTPFAQPASTYALRGAVLTRVWRYPAQEWIPPNYLSDSGDTSVLDLRSGRTYHGQTAQAILARVRATAWEVRHEGEFYVGEEDATADPSALEGSPPGTSLESRRWRVIDRSFALAAVREGDGSPRTVVSTEDDVPRSMELAKNASPLALSRDGRTLFFSRDGALWRLDLIRPVSSLLDATLTLPEPPEDSATAAR
jgi:hypothetical protein